jgi:hypothetical protein
MVNTAHHATIIIFPSTSADHHDACVDRRERTDRMHGVYGLLVDMHPPPCKPETFAKKSQRRSPNKRTNRTSCASSSAVHGPFLVAAGVSSPPICSLTSFIMTCRWLPCSIRDQLPISCSSAVDLALIIGASSCHRQRERERERERERA